MKVVEICLRLYLITNRYGCILGKGNVDRIRECSARDHGYHLQDGFCGNVQDGIMQNHSIFTGSSNVFTTRKQRVVIFYFRVMLLSKGKKERRI
jgi:hypothetical protein